jgi:hypothetical protein
MVGLASACRLAAAGGPPSDRASTRWRCSGSCTRFTAPSSRRCRCPASGSSPASFRSFSRTSSLSPTSLGAPTRSPTGSPCSWRSYAGLRRFGHSAGPCRYRPGCYRHLRWHRPRGCRARARRDQPAIRYWPPDILRGWRCRRCRRRVVVQPCSGHRRRPRE